MQKRLGFIALAACVALWGCAEQKAKDSHAGHDHGDGHDHSAQAETKEPKAASPELAKIITAEGAPDRVTGVAAARKDAKAGDSIMMIGRVKDFVKGQAVFTVVDPIIPACNDIPGDMCETPWDYCCEPKEKLTAHTATVKLVGENNETIKESVEGVSGVDHLTTVVAEGKAERDEAGNLLIAATKLYLKKPIASK
jgi:hypothetical protein